MTFLQLLRVKQYHKNIFAIAALLFTKGFTNPHLILLTLGAIAVMCLVGSTTYIVNDIIDVNRDRAHPTKKNRPIASGRVSVQQALVVAGICLILGLGLATWISLSVLGCALFYLALQVIYNLKLKHVPIADVFVIGAGFVLRVVIGAVAIDAKLSGWILICTGALALLLGFGKRRSEFVERGEDRSQSRESLQGYSLQALDAFVTCSGAVAILCYGLYTIQSQTARQYPGLIITIPFVAFGIFRYMMLIFSNSDTAEPESVVIQDGQIILSFILFVIATAIALTGLQVGLLNP